MAVNTTRTYEYKIEIAIVIIYMWNFRRVIYMATMRLLYSLAADVDFL